MNMFRPRHPHREEVSVGPAADAMRKIHAFIYKFHKRACLKMQMLLQR